ncbi:MAG: ATP-binding protein [Rhizobacter sp.]|jgi:signal transduction histidine kinase
MNSIRLRLLLALLAMLATAAAVLGGVTYRNVLVQTEALFDYQLRQMALSLRDQGEIAPSQAGALADGELDFVVQIWSVDGRSIYATRDHANLPARALLGLAEVSVNGQVWRTFSVATRDRVIQVAQPALIRKRLAADAALRSVLPLLFLAPVLALFGWWVVARSLAPLERVAAGVRQRDEHVLDPLPTSGLPDEVEPLVGALNALLVRLGESFDTQRAFVADAAHELRSPLTALTLQLRLLRRAPDEASREAALTALGAGIERSTRLVEQLLTLARSEPSAAAPPPAALDLAEVVRQALVDAVPYAVSRGSELELHADEPVPLTGDRTALGVLARNLADNALRYSPPGAHVVVRVGRADGVPFLQVDDNGPGIPPDERSRVFDRFYRRESSDEGGSGLGLAIVDSIARRHHARVTLSDSPLGGLRAMVRFGDSR